VLTLQSLFFFILHLFARNNVTKSSKAKAKANQDTGGSTDFGTGKLVKLNVGMHYYCIYYDTLKVSPYSKDMLSGDDMESLPMVNDDGIFIDRSGNLFEYILQYLRDYEINAGKSVDLEELKMEAEYYKLSDMVEGMMIF
jgi:hypothetical protein